MIGNVGEGIQSVISWWSLIWYTQERCEVSLDALGMSSLLRYALSVRIGAKQ